MVRRHRIKWPRRKVSADKVSGDYKEVADPASPYSEYGIRAYLMARFKCMGVEIYPSYDPHSVGQRIMDNFDKFPDWLKILRIEYWDSNYIANLERIQEELEVKASGFHVCDSREIWFKIPIEDKDLSILAHEIGHNISRLLGILEKREVYSDNTEWRLAVQKDLERSPGRQLRNESRPAGYMMLHEHLYATYMEISQDGGKIRKQYYNEHEHEEEAFAVFIANYLILYNIHNGNHATIFKYLEQDMPHLSALFEKDVLPVLKKHAADLLENRKEKIDKINQTMTCIEGFGFNIAASIIDKTKAGSGSIIISPEDLEPVSEERAAEILLAGYGPDSGKRLASLVSYVLRLRSFFKEEGHKGLLDPRGEFEALLDEFLDPLSTNTYKNFVEFSETYGLRDRLKSVFEKAMRGYFESFKFLHEVGKTNASDYVRNEIRKNMEFLNVSYPLNDTDEHKIETLKGKFNSIFTNIGFYKRHEYLSRKLKTLLDRALSQTELEDWDLSQLSLASYQNIVSVFGDLKSKKPFTEFDDDGLLRALECCLNSEVVKDNIKSRLSEFNDRDQKYKSKTQLLEIVIGNILFDFFPKYVNNNENPVIREKALPGFMALAA